MKTRRAGWRYLEELGCRFAIAEASVFSGVTYGTAERTIDAVKGAPCKPGAFWIQLAELAMEKQSEANTEDCEKLSRSAGSKSSSKTVLQ